MLKELPFLNKKLPRFKSEDAEREFWAKIFLARQIKAEQDATRTKTTNGKKKRAA